MPLLAGRAFAEADLQGDVFAVIVNRSFSRRILNRESPVGRRVRDVVRSGNANRGMEGGRWFEIVGVVEDFAHNPNFDGGIPTLYTPVAANQLVQADIAIRMRTSEAANVAARLREIAAAVDPTIRLYGISHKGDELRQERRALHALALVVGVAMLCVILLSSAGVYALMSFTVTQRRREIGIRTALGGQARRILLSIFARAVAQLAAGVFAGVVLAALLDTASGGGLFDGRASIVLSIGSLVMMAVGLAAALGPARRGLSIQPTEALREG